VAKRLISSIYANGSKLKEKKAEQKEEKRTLGFWVALSIVIGGVIDWRIQCWTAKTSSIYESR
jgi:hypothetical protein